MKNRVLITLFVLLATSILASAQEITTATGKLPHQEKGYTIAWYPFHHIANGVRFDFEKRIKNTPAWIQAGVTGYSFSPEDSEYNFYTLSGEFNYLRGGGLELNYKRFINVKESMYLAGGCSYNHYNVKYFDYYWRSYTENNLDYWVNEYGNMKQKINKFGINTYLGYQLPTPTFLFDIFVGLGYRYSFRSNSAANSFDDSMLALGYRGIVFMTGVRLGVKFK
jgi:hypothetical protein